MRLLGTIFLFLLVVAGIIFINATALSRFVWNTWHQPYIAAFLDRDDAPLALEIGTQYFGGMGYDPNAALFAFERATAIDPSILWGHYDSARVLFVQNKFTEAREEIEKELQYNPDNLRSYYMLGLINAYDNQLSEAEANFKKFVKWAPLEWAGYNDLAWALAQEERYDEARATLKSALHSVPDAENNAWLWNNLGVQNLNLKNYTEAVGDFEKAKELAAKLTLEDWHNAYPGNNPASLADGLQQFKDAIEKNLGAAKNH